MKWLYDDAAFGKSCPKSGFIGGSAIDRVNSNKKLIDIDRISDGAAKRNESLFEVGEVVRVIDGPFADFNGVVEEVNYEKASLSRSNNIRTLNSGRVRI